MRIPTIFLGQSATPLRKAVQETAANSDRLSAASGQHPWAPSDVQPQRGFRPAQDEGEASILDICCLDFFWGLWRSFTFFGYAQKSFKILQNLCILLFSFFRRNGIIFLFVYMISRLNSRLKNWHVLYVGSHFCLRETTIKNRDPPTGDHLHLLHGRASCHAGLRSRGLLQARRRRGRRASTRSWTSRRSTPSSKRRGAATRAY